MVLADTGLHQTQGEEIPEIRWVHGDDLCDCTFQRLGEWTNPYLAKTMRVRMCCMWAELEKMFPHLVQHIPAFYNENTDLFETDFIEWNSPDGEMPRALWHRQLSVAMGLPLDEIRNRTNGKESPGPVPRIVEPAREVPKRELAMENSQNDIVLTLLGRKDMELEMERQRNSALIQVIVGLKNGSVKLDDIDIGEAPQESSNGVSEKAESSGN